MKSAFYKPILNIYDSFVIEHEHFYGRSNDANCIQYFKKITDL